MKKIIYSFLAMFLFFGAIAQPCTPNGTPLKPGLTPPTHVVAPFFTGQNNSLTIYFKNLDTIATGTALGTRPVKSLTINTIVNLPGGLSWQANKTPATFARNENGCIIVTGTPNAPCGQYKLKIYITLVVDLGLLGTATVQGDADSLARAQGAGNVFLYYARISGPCADTTLIPVDTFQTALFRGYACDTGNVKPTAGVTASGPLSFCQGGSVKLTADSSRGYTYKWSTGATTRAITVTTANTYKVTVYNNTVKKCDSTVSANQVVTTTTPPTVSVRDTSVCSGSPATLTATPSTGGGTYSWSPGGALTQSITVTPTGNSTYTVTYSLAGCVVTGTGTITLKTKPSVIINKSSASVCLGNADTLTAVPTPAGGTYSWSPVSGSNSQLIVSPTSLTTYTVTNTQNGCVGTATASVAVNLPPTAAITPAGPIVLCGGTPQTLTASPSGASYVWYKDNVVQGGQTLNTLSVNAAASYKVVVTQSGCSATSNIVSVSTNTGSANVTITPANPVLCAGTPITLDAGAGYTTYAWSGGGSGQTKSAATATTYTVTVTLVSGGCTATGSKSVTVTAGTNVAAPTITPNGSTAICAGGSVGLDAGAGYTTYAWSGGLGATQSVNATTPATYTVTVTKTGQCGTGVSSITVSAGTNVSSPTITTNGGTVVCPSKTLGLDAGAGYTTYAWSNGLGAAQTATAPSASVYTVTVTKTGFCGSSTGSITVTTGVNVSNPTIVPNGSTTICLPGSVGLDAGTGYTTYAWSNGLGAAQTATASGAGTYTVSVTTTGLCGTGVASITVSAGASVSAPTITSTKTGAFCEGDSAILDAGNGYTTYAWSAGGSSQTIVAKSPSISSYTVTVTQSGLCGAATASASVSVKPIPQCSFSANGTLLTALPAGGSYQWIFNGSPIQVGGTSQTYTATQAGGYSVQVSQNGCSCTTPVQGLNVGINDIAADLKYLVYPNPASDKVIVSYDLGNETKVTIYITDLAGRKVAELFNDKQSRGSHNLSVDLSSYSNGVYLVNLQTEKGKAVSKIVKQ